MALEHFKPYIDGVQVHLDTDHRNLRFIESVKHSTGQLARWAMRLSEFNYKLKYRPGSEMHVADCLSRNPLPEEIDKEEAALFGLYESSELAYICSVTELPRSEDGGAQFEIFYTRKSSELPHVPQSAIVMAFMSEMLPSHFF